MKTELLQKHSQQDINNQSSLRLLDRSGWEDETAVRALFRLDSLFLSHQGERKTKGNKYLLRFKGILVDSSSQLFLFSIQPLKSATRTDNESGNLYFYTIFPFVRQSKFAESEDVSKPNKGKSIRTVKRLNIKL